jgi:hypothetical protein
MMFIGRILSRRVLKSDRPRLATGVTEMAGVVAIGGKAGDRPVRYPTAAPSFAPAGRPPLGSRMRFLAR